MGIASAIYGLVMKAGAFGLLVLGILDSSFLFVPWGNDLMIVALTARHPEFGKAILYAVASTIGSVLGCFLLDLACRPLGEKGLEKRISPKKLKKLQAKVGKNAGRAVAIAAVVPPPFPFTAVVMVASALQYSRRRLLIVIGIFRMVRFVIVALLALRFGKAILKWADNSFVQGFLITLIIICIVGSVISVYGWLRRR